MNKHANKVRNEIRNKIRKIHRIPNHEIQSATNQIRRDEVRQGGRVPQTCKPKTNQHPTGKQTNAHKHKQNTLSTLNPKPRIRCDATRLGKADVCANPVRSRVISSRQVPINPPSYPNPLSDQQSFGRVGFARGWGGSISGATQCAPASYLPVRSPYPPSDPNPPSDPRSFGQTGFARGGGGSILGQPKSAAHRDNSRLKAKVEPLLM